MPKIFGPITLIDALTALNSKGTLSEAELVNCNYVTVYVNFSTGAAAGTVLIESSSNKDFTGVWALEATVNWSVADKEFSVRVTGPNLALRARISSAITGGTVTVKAIGGN